MRNFLFYVISIATLTLSFRLHSQTVSPCLVSSGIVTGNCSVVGDPYIESPCIAGIQKQIARSINAENLAEWVIPETCWGWIGTNGTPYQESLIPPGNTPVNCVPPYDKCYGHYCPDKYCSLIKAFVDMKASFILRATNTWDNHGSLKPGTSYYQAMKQIVTDINAAYDCAGLRRPVIQGTIFEYITTSVNSVPIPADIINEFRTTPGFDNTYYLDFFGNPKTINFNRDRIIKQPIADPWPNTPSISRIEAKMWFFYLAKMYIDMGYKSIHMGQMDNWAYLDNNYSSTTILLNKIRAYAQSKNTFVLLTEENRKAVKFPGTNTFMYDFDVRALLPREISNPQVCGENNCTNTPVNYLTNTPCANQTYPAVIDACIITSAGNTSGLSPLYGCLLPYQPFSTYFDFGTGLFNASHPASPGCSGQYGVWGWDDARWFAEGISSQNCRAFWIQDGICRMRQFYNGFGFMGVPGLLYANKPENGGKYLQGINPTSDGRYLLTDEPLVKNAILSAWTVNANPGIQREVICGSPIGGTCPLFNLPKRSRINRYKVASPDCTSSYSWHIKDPNNNWLSMSYGTTRDLSAAIAGTYTIYLRIDNLGLPGGVTQIEYQDYLEPYCCTADVLEPFLLSNPVVLLDGHESSDPLLSDLHNNEVFSTSSSRTATDNVTAFPSPASSLFTIKASAPEYNAGSFTITDITGRIIFESSPNININNGVSISCKDWANGLYLIHVTSLNGSNTTLKILKF